MTPAEKFARIRYEDMGFKEPYDDLDPVIKADEERIARRQIRALAAMEPTEKLMKAATKQTGLLPDRAIKHAVHDFLLAAAAEGDA
jgi:hypothetical protein